MTEKEKLLKKLNELSISELREIGFQFNIKTLNRSRVEIIQNLITQKDVKSIEDYARIFAPNSIAEAIVLLWIKKYRANKIPTVLVTILVIGGAIVGGIITENNRNAQKEAITLESLNYGEQLKNLNEVEKSIRDLSEFVQSQKDEIIQEEEYLQQLEKKNKELEPVVNTKEETVKNIFSNYQQLQEAERKKELLNTRTEGIVIGVIGSLIASVIIGIFMRLRKQKIIEEIETK